jgi:cytosine/adenosine deaminase-related metal-dependent hydrolase
MAVHRPAALLGLEPGGLEPGEPADLVEFDLAEPSEPGGPRQFQVRSTVIDGEVVFSEDSR